MADQQKQWVIRIRRGDRDAFRALFDAYYGRLCAFAVEYAGSMDRARDVVQDVFLTLWERRQDWILHGSLKSYLYQAVRNRALNASRNRATRRRAYEAHGQHRGRVDHRTAEDQACYHQLSAAIRRSIDELPPRRRMVFLLHRHHDLTYAEVAQTMGIARKTVENQMGRALKFLRERLHEDMLPEW